jgi:hypothetical protein
MQVFMKTKRHLLQIWLLCAALLPAAAQTQFTFTTNNDGSLNISRYTGSGGVVVIPSTTNGLAVTSIGTNAFQNCTSLTSVTIPNSVTSIGNEAFFDCGSLTSVTIGTNVTSIGDFAFGNCTSLASVTIPNSVTNIGAYAFGDCGLTSVTIPNSVTSIGEEAFGICSSLTNVTISTSVTNIGAYAFEFCGLARVTIPNSVTNIGAYAFYGCSSLTGVTISNSVTSIGGYAFYGCSCLTGIYFQGNAPSLGSAVFYGDNYATVYYLPGTSGWSSPFGGRPAVMLNPPNPAGSLQVTLSPAAAITAGAQWQVDGGVEQPSGAIVLGLSVGNHTVSFSPANGWAMPASQSVAVSANSTATASGTYGQLTYTTNNGAITITKYTGPGCAVVLPGTINGLPVTSIGSQAFYDCTSLTSVTIPNSVTNIGVEAFGWCISLTNITIGSSVTSIGSEAFDNCKSLAAITVNTNNPAYSSVAGVLFNKSQTTLIEYPRGGAGTYYTIPNSVTNIGSNAFFRCYTLASVTFGTNLTSIGSQAFYQCSKLSNVIIPDSVASIGSQAFYNCYLTGIYFQGNAPSLGGHVFDFDNKTTVYYLPWTTGWGTPGAPFGGVCPTALWLPQVQTSNASFGVLSNQFGFNITWASDMVIVVEACTNLANPAWTPVGTNTLTGGSSYFSDSQWTNYPGRFYRLRSP